MPSVLPAHLRRLEAESIHIMREVVAEMRNPVMLYSIGKDSSVMLHVAMKAFYPAKPPFPLLHVDTTWKFKEMYAMRDRMPKELGFELLVHQNPEAKALGINPFDHGPLHTDMWKTQGLKQALDQHGFDVAIESHIPGGIGAFGESALRGDDLGRRGDGADRPRVPGDRAERGAGGKAFDISFHHRARRKIGGKAGKSVGRWPGAARVRQSGRFDQAIAQEKIESRREAGGAFWPHEAGDDPHQPARPDRQILMQRRLPAQPQDGRRQRRRRLDPLRKQASKIACAQQQRHCRLLRGQS